MAASTSSLAAMLLLLTTTNMEGTHAMGSNAADVASAAAEMDCPPKLIPAALKGCKVVTEKVLDAVLTCTSELDIKVPCAFVAIVRGEDWTACDDDIDVWMEFGSQVRKKCLAKCAFQQLGLMDEEGLLLHGHFFRYLHTHFFEDVPEMSDAIKNNFSLCMQNPPQNSLFNPFGEKDDGERAAGCTAAEMAIECSVPIVVDRVMSCMSGVCQKLSMDPDARRKKRAAKHSIFGPF